jgi:hypothetical protein
MPLSARRDGGAGVRRELIHPLVAEHLPRGEEVVKRA